MMTPLRSSVRVLRLFIASMLTGFALAVEVQAAEPLAPVFASSTFAAKAAAAIGVLLVLAILLENALAPIFNWRVFLTYFSLRGIKTPIMIAAAALLVWTFNLDIVAQLFKYGQEQLVEGNARIYEGNLGTVGLTALILSGGSAGIHELMKALGLRKDGDAEAIKKALAPYGSAWVAVSVRNPQGKDSILVHIEPQHSAVAAALPAVAPDDIQAMAIAGTVSAGLRTPMHLFVRDSKRFPQNGGYTVKPDTRYRIALSWTEDGQARSKNLALEGFKFADRAIVDLEVTL